MTLPTFYQLRLLFNKLFFPRFLKAEEKGKDIKYHANKFRGLAPLHIATFI